MLFICPVKCRLRAKSTIIGDGKDGKLMIIAKFYSSVKLIDAKRVDIIEEVFFIVIIQNV